MFSGINFTVVEWQIEVTLVRLLLQEQSDLGLHSLYMPFYWATLVYEILGHLL